VEQPNLVDHSRTEYGSVTLMRATAGISGALVLPAEGALGSTIEPTASETFEPKELYIRLGGSAVASAGARASCEVAGTKAAFGTARSVWKC
jgi:hypothetical protein